MRQLPPKARVLAFITTAIIAVPLAMIVWWALRWSFIAFGPHATDDNAWLFLALTLLMAIGLIAVTTMFLHEVANPQLERFYIWYGKYAVARRREAENRRLADAFHATGVQRDYLSNVLDQARVRAESEREHWRNAARSEIAAPKRSDGDAGIFSAYARASTYHRMLVREGYHALLAISHPRHQYHTPLAIADLPPLARILFLPVAIEATDASNGFDRLDLDASDHGAGRYVYRAEYNVPDLAHWTANLPAIEAYLGGRWRIARGTGATLTLTKLPHIPEQFALPPDALKPDAVYFGRDLNSGAAFHVPLSAMSHTLVAGPTGMGKSVLLHQLMASVVFNIDAFETVHLVDLKYGIELQDYAELHPKCHLTTDPANIGTLLGTLVNEMDQRGALMRERRWTEWKGPLVLIVIDEFADVLLAEPDKKKRDALETALVRLTNLSRALGFRFWIQSQKTTADALPAAIRNNLQSVISFRMVTNQAAAMLFGGIEHLPADITTLKRGQAIYRDGRTSDTVAFQAALATFADVEAALLASAATTNPPADYSA